MRAVLSAIALAAGAVVLLLRIAGRSPVTTIWAEDRTVFLVQALAAPWHLFASYAGYLQLLPRIIGQLVAFLPLPDAAAAFAISGAVIASAVALFVFHASAGHIHSGWLRGLLAAAVLLLPVAPLEIADSGVNTPWYLLFALFWAALAHRLPRRRVDPAPVVACAAVPSAPRAPAPAPRSLGHITLLRRLPAPAAADRPGPLLPPRPVGPSPRRARLDRPPRRGAALRLAPRLVAAPALG